MIINEVKISDAEGIAELELILFPDNCLNSLSLKKEISVGTGFTAYHDGELLGYVIARWDFANELLDIIRLGVTPTSQRQGIGSRLLISILKANDTDIMLMARKNNLQALRMYKRRGFEIIAQTEASWVMMKLITC